MRIRGTAVVIRNDKVLLVRDRGKKSYSLPGGGRNKNEPSLAAAARELYEELGMRALKAQRIIKCDFEGSFSRHQVTLIETNDDPVIQSLELDEFIWLNMKDNIPRYKHVTFIMEKLGKVENISNN